MYKLILFFILCIFITSTNCFSLTKEEQKRIIDAVKIYSDKSVQQISNYLVYRFQVESDLLEFQSKKIP